jgi:hypothetical protein
MEGEDEIEIKQNYLRQEIIEKGYSPDEFANYLEKIGGENASDLNSYSLEDLQKIVQNFKESQDLAKQNEEKEEKEIKEEEKNIEIKKEEKLEKKEIKEKILEKIIYEKKKKKKKFLHKMI